MPAGDLHLARVDADAHADSEVRHRGIHQLGSAYRLGSAVEEREEAIASRVDLAAAETVDRGSDPHVMRVQHPCPSVVADPLENGRRVDDVTEENGREHALAQLLGRSTEGVC